MNTSLYVTTGTFLIVHFCVIVDNKKKNGVRMIKYLPLVIMLLLVGCETDNNNHGYGFEYDEISDLGIKIRYFSGAFMAPPIEIDSAFNNAKLCTGLEAPPPPYVVIVSDREFINFDAPNADLNGVFLTSPNLIAIIDDGVRVGSYGTLNHEYIHYLSYMNGFNSDFNSDHSNLFFLTCSL